MRRPWEFVGAAGRSWPRLLGALEDSAARLATLVESLGPDDVRRPAYPTEWSVAQVLSHIGSGAVITQRRLEVALAGGDDADGEDAQRAIWAEWDAKDPERQATDALVADRRLLDRLRAMDEAEQSRLAVPLGPYTFDAFAFVRLRLGEHVLHTWDIEVVWDPDATLASGAADLLLDGIGLFVQVGGRAIDRPHTVAVAVPRPRRRFDVSLGPGGVSLTEADPATPHDVELPAESWIRLAYGRLDPDHTPRSVVAGASLALLRETFPGM